MKPIQFALYLSLALLAQRPALANLTGPYTPDANTPVLLHLDEAAGGSVTTNNGSLGGNLYAVNYSSTTTPLPLVTTMLGATGFSVPPTNFNNCESNTTAGYELGYDYNRDGVFEPDTGNGSGSVDFLPMSTLGIGVGGNKTPFTLEALICPTNIAANEEIICTDSQGSQTPAGRGFQFRITSGSLQFQFITGLQAVSAAIPTSGSDAFVAGTWYHVAVVYDGAKATLYWTKLDPTLGAAHVLGTPAALNLTNGAITGPLIIGNRGRPTGVETFPGAIDEVRISSVARAANQMQFYSPLVTITQNPVNQNVDFNQPVTFTVGASSLTPLGYQWLFNSNSIAGATNTSYVITNVAAANAGYYSAVVTNTAGYAATSSPALLVVGAANFLNHRYSFTTSYTNATSTNTYVPDLVGGADGTNNGDAYVTNGALVLDGTAGTFMQLPAKLFNATNATALTVEFWATYGVNANNAYVFSFGYTNYIIGSGLVGIDYVNFSPHNASGNGLYISPSDSSFSQSVTNAGTLDGAAWHVACVIDPPDQTLAIYTNGVLEAINTNLTVNLANVNDALSYIGASLFAADPYLVANIDELRLYNGALSGISIKQSDAQGPNTVLADGPAKFVVNPASTMLAPGLTTTFTAAAVGYLPITYQWFTNGTPVPGATNTSYSFTAVGANTNAPVNIVCQAMNTIGVTTYVTNSATATLTVVNPLSLVWTGQNSAAWDTSTLNWLNPGTSATVAFSPFANVTFDSRGSSQPTVNLTQAVNPLGVTVNSTAAYTFNSPGQNGSLTGPGTLTKANSGTLIIDVTNGLTGSVMIAGGTLQVGNNDTLGAIGSPVTNNASLVLERSDATVMPSPIYGTGTVTMASGNVTASGASYYTGNTFINSGVTFLGNASGLGATNGTITVIDGAELYITANADVGLNPLVIGGAGPSGAGALRKGGAGTTTCYGTITLADDTTLNVDGGATLNLTNSAGIAAPSGANLFLNGSGAGNITGPLSLGSASGITVNGGVWTVAPSNNFSGVVSLDGGALRITGGQSLGPVPASFNSGQITIQRGTLEAATNITLNDGKIGIAFGDNGGITKDAGATFTISNQISSYSAGFTLTNAGPGTLVLNGANPFNGTLFMDTGSQTANDGMVVIANNAAIANIPAITGVPYIVFRSQNAGGATLALDGTLGSITVAPDISLTGRTGPAPAIENLAGSNIISGNFTLGTGGSYILQSDSGMLTLTQPWPYQPPAGVSTARGLTLTGAGGITMAGGIQDVILSNTNVPVSVLKLGSGILNLPVANLYSGATVVSNGLLSLTGSLGGTNTVTVAGGLLVGNGSITGPVTVQPAGAIEAGTTNTIGTLNLSSTLALAGNTIVKISKTSGVKDLFTGQSSVTYGGTLTVTNLAGTLTTNDTFILFTPGVSASNFANIAGSPGAGLRYTFTNGILSVAIGSKPTPHLTSVSVSGTTLKIYGTNGTPGGPYALLGSTNAALPFSQWTPLLTNYFDANGIVNLTTNIVNPSLPAEFYLLSQ